MASDETRDERKLKDSGRRALLKAAAVAGGAAAGSALLPGSWKKPVATLGGLPAHAQNSAGLEISDASATATIPVSGLIGGFFIDCECDYQDFLGEFADNHYVTFEVTPGILPNTSAQMAKFAGGCNLPSECLLSAATPLTIVGDGHLGLVKFRVNSSCFPPAFIAWYLYKNEFHKSRWVNASVTINYYELPQEIAER